MSEIRHVDEEHMRHCLREAYRQDAERSLLWQLAKTLNDPLKPHNEKGRWRIHPLILLLAGLAAIALATFIYMSVLGS